MIAVHCPSHDARVLLSFHDVEEMRNTHAGIEVRYRCTCGHRGTWVTGKRRS